MRSSYAHYPHPSPRRDARGFTLIELMITLLVLVVVLGAMSSILYLVSRSKTSTTNRIESVQSARTGMEMIAGDMRSAGYNADVNFPATPQPQIAYIDSTQVLIDADLSPFPSVMTPGRFVAPRAYDPAGTPKPAPLSGTVWTPPVKYRTGAEVTRYTLDANNDGVVDANDQSDPNGSSASATQNPNDYALVRQVYGDSTGNSAGNNGGSSEQIALVNKPGGTVPPLFTVYLKGSAIPWNWANGPVPPAQLGNIERVEVKVSSPSSKPDDKGAYAQTILTTEVHSMRNVPNFGAAQFAVSGYVFNDQNLSGVKDAGEPGLATTQVRLGPYSTFTDAVGFYQFRVFAGNYVLRHTPLPAYGSFASPDTFLLNVNTAMTRSFPDTARQGGPVNLRVYEDLNTNGTFDGSDHGMPNIKASLMPGPVTGTTDASGRVSLFARTGAYTVSLVLPDTLITSSTPYPVTGVMINGGSAAHDIGVVQAQTGNIAGKVFIDNNRDGVWQSGETGLTNVWVGVTNDGGTTIVGYAYTDATGNYTITVPVNDPPRTRPYSVFYIPPGGKFPTNSTSIGGLWVQNGVTLANNNFGAASFQIITLSASRVLSLQAGDLMEKDWNGNQTQNAEGDQDIVLGADAGGTDNISVWFDNYPPTKGINTNLFTPTPDYTRNAPQSVMSIALDTLDSDPTWSARPDVVTGTKLTAAGNFFVWLNQNTSGNYGFLPTTYSPGMNYRTNDGGDVQSVLTMDCAGGSMPDIIVGTKSPTAGRGSIEVWQNDDAVTPTFTQQEVYPSAGAIPGGNIGEVNAMLLADLNHDGNKELIVATRTASYNGEIIVFQNVSKSNGARFVCAAKYNLIGNTPTALAAMDMNGDGNVDIIAGTQSSVASGNLMVFQNVSTIGTNWSFANVRNVVAPGIVMTLAAADFGGNSHPDLAVGWRSTSTGFVGGLSIYFITDLSGLPLAGTDPSSGAIAFMVPAVCTGNFDYGLYPLAPTPYLTDLAAGVKNSATTGALVVFVR